MSNADGKQPDFDDFNLPGDEPPLENLDGLDLPDASDPMSSLEELDLPEGGDLPPVSSPESAAEGVEEVAAVEETADEPATGKKKRKSKGAGKKKERKEKPARVAGEGVGPAGIATFAVCGLSVLGLLAMDAMVFKDWGILFMILVNVFWLMATAIPLIMWLGRKRLNFYEVMLGIALAGIIIAVMLLLGELARYGGETTPKGGTAAALQLGAERTMALA